MQGKNTRCRLSRLLLRVGAGPNEVADHGACFIGSDTKDAVARVPKNLEARSVDSRSHLLMIGHNGDGSSSPAIIPPLSAPKPYYRRDLALVHHMGFSFHADACAPGILALLQPVRDRDGLVLELGCGSGALTRHLVDAGHRVVATDASPAMLELAREVAPGADAICQLILPGDPLPDCDAIVSVGHVLSYLPDEGSVEVALVAAAAALRPGGVFAIDLCDLRYGEGLPAGESGGRVGDDWAVATRLSLPQSNRFVREITTFLRDEDGSWRRDDERHENVLLDTSRLPTLLARHGLDVRVSTSFGDEVLPHGLVAIVGRRRVA
jgi:SAM-dependent methyltransferase